MLIIIVNPLKKSYGISSRIIFLVCYKLPECLKTGRWRENLFFFFWNLLILSCSCLLHGLCSVDATLWDTDSFQDLGALSPAAVNYFQLRGFQPSGSLEIASAEGECLTKNYDTSPPPGTVCIQCLIIVRPERPRPFTSMGTTRIMLQNSPIRSSEASLTNCTTMQLLPLTSCFPHLSLIVLKSFPGIPMSKSPSQIFHLGNQTDNSSQILFWEPYPEIRFCSWISHQLASNENR